MKNISVYNTFRSVLRLAAVYVPVAMSESIVNVKAIKLYDFKANHNNSKYHSVEFAIIYLQ
jgi:peptidoglycan biosynthesis protein MviN/MurJ (putative lipid II flippase)